MNTISCNYSRDSFDRFGDDLCELILSELLLIDKFRYESVCKQWQRLIFNKHHKLIIDYFDGKYSVKRLRSSSYEETKYYTIFTLHKYSFESLLKKCFNINSIEFNWKCICDEQTLLLIAKYCSHLQRFTFSSNNGFSLSDEVLSQFGRACGQKLRHFRTDSNFNGNLKLLLSHCHNLRSIYAINDSQKLVDCDQSFLPKLQEIDFMVTEDSDLTYFELLANKYFNKMKKLTICIKIGDNNNEVISSDINQIFKQMVRFANLEYLRINLKSYFGQPFADGLKMIGRMCTKLKFFSFESYDTIILENVFQLFENFKALEYFSLHCRYLYRFESVESVDQTVNYGRVKCFENCKNLLYLKLNLLHLNDSNLENIDLYLPNLKLIELKSSKNLTNQSLSLIAKLRGLKSLRISCSNEISDTSISNLIDSCPLLNDIYFDGNPNISKDVIETLITKAKKNEKIEYKFYYSGIPIKIPSIPSNLHISNFWDKQWY